MAADTKYIKERTLEIYASMPQDKELRKQCIKERDELIELNYAFFGYVASKTFINNSSVTYEDKLQSAIMHFCECFWWYKWKGDETHKGYRQDLSFTVFFKPRIGEMIERELNEVKYSVRRSLCMEAGAQLGKHWGKVTYDDLRNVNLPANKLDSLKAIFGSLYIADLSDYEMYFHDDHADDDVFSEEWQYNYDVTIVEDVSNDYDSLTNFQYIIDTFIGTQEDVQIRYVYYDNIKELLKNDMMLLQTKLDDVELRKMSDMYGINFNVLKESLPEAEQELVEVLQQRIDIKSGFY